MLRKYSPSASKHVERAMRRRKKGTLKSGKGGRGGTVKSRKQAIAIGLSEAQEGQEGAEAASLKIGHVVVGLPLHGQHTR